MLSFLRRRLGMLKHRLERRVETLSSGGSARPAQLPISEADRNFILDWITGKVDDRAMIARAQAAGDGFALIERACVVKSGNPHVWAARAGMCLDSDRIAEATDYAERAYVLGRFEPEIALQFVQVLVAAGRRDEALLVMPDALETARRKGAHAIRLELCRQWQALEPQSPGPPLESARTRVAMRELDAAIAEFEALSARFGPRSDILLPLAAVYQDLVRIEDAGRVYARAVEAEPDNVDALCMAGICARDLRDTAAADRLLSRAFELDPKLPFAQYNLGLLRLDQGRIDEAARLVLGARASNRGEPWSPDALPARLAAPVARNIADPDWATARFKLLHDIEQLAYLRLHNRIGVEVEPAIAEYQAILRSAVLPEDAYSMVALDPSRFGLLARSYKMPIHAADPEPPSGPLLNPDRAWKEIEENYRDTNPGFLIVDDLLSAEALAALRSYCLESTLWNELKGGHLGAYMADGFSGRLLLGIAAALRSMMPCVLRDHPLQNMWADKYDSRYAGTGLHVDTAAINVNLWITPDQANLDPHSGGLVVYTHDGRPGWRDQRLNADVASIYRHLESIGANKVRVPHRANRAVIFDSDLFHETDALDFRPGYENRRVNLTMLYGTRAG